MSFKEKVHKILLELGEGESYSDIKKDIMESLGKDLKVNMDAYRKVSEEKMEAFFANVTKNIKQVVVEVLNENPELLKGGKNEKRTV